MVIYNLSPIFYPFLFVHVVIFATAPNAPFHACISSPSFASANVDIVVDVDCDDDAFVLLLLLVVLAGVLPSMIVLLIQRMLMVF